MIFQKTVYTDRYIHYGLDIENHDKSADCRSLVVVDLLLNKRKSRSARHIGYVNNPPVMCLRIICTPASTIGAK